MGGGGGLGEYRLTVGRGPVNEADAYPVGYLSGSYGDLSPNTFEEKTITRITRFVYGSDTIKAPSTIIISGLSQGTIYFGRYDTKQSFEMPYSTASRGFLTYNEQILGEADIGKTIPVYIGWTPPEF